MLKFLFLDIDGVMNHSEYTKRNKGLEYPYYWFDPYCVERVNKIIELTGAKLVVSSSWRFDKNLWKDFEKVGLPIKFDITPRLNNSIRGEEIKSFLDDINEEYTYCILDDDSDMLDIQMGNLVQTTYDRYNEKLYNTNKGTGLTDLCTEKAMKILNNEK